MKSRNRNETVYNFEAHFHWSFGAYTVTVPKLPGLVTQGDTLREAREMAKDAIQCYLEAWLKDILPQDRSAALRKEYITARIRV